jgi:hypothetical protein
VFSPLVERRSDETGALKHGLPRQRQAEVIVDGQDLPVIDFYVDGFRAA